jgi:hypothetical protein
VIRGFLLTERTNTQYTITKTLIRFPALERFLLPQVSDMMFHMEVAMRKIILAAICAGAFGITAGAASAQTMGPGHHDTRMHNSMRMHSPMNAQARMSRHHMEKRHMMKKHRMMKRHHMMMKHRM